MTTSGPQVYDPQLRTPIKKPENKVCPTCGQPTFQEVQAMSNHMNQYHNAETGAVIGVMNSNADKVITKEGITLLRKDVYEASLAKSSVVAPVKVSAPILVPNAPVSSVVASKPLGQA